MSDTFAIADDAGTIDWRGNLRKAAAIMRDRGHCFCNFFKPADEVYPKGRVCLNEAVCRAALNLDGEREFFTENHDVMINRPELTQFVRFLHTQGLVESCNVGPAALCDVNNRAGMTTETAAQLLEQAAEQQ